MRIWLWNIILHEAGSIFILYIICLFWQLWLGPAPNKSRGVKYFLKALVTQFHVPLTEMCCNAKRCVVMKR